MKDEKKEAWSRVTPIHPLKTAQDETDTKGRLLLINKEFSDGFEFIRKYPKSVTIFGSAVLSKDHPYYKKAEGISAELSRQGYTIVTGGGPGIMEAANKGAYEAGGQSIGLNIKLPKEQHPNSYLTDEYEFYYFFSRKVVLSFAAEAYLFFPGGFGTLNEFFEIVTLVQTHRIGKVPLVLVGSEFWRPLEDLIKNNLLEKFGTIKKTDLEIFSLLDKDEDIIEKVKSSPVLDTIPFAPFKK